MIFDAASDEGRIVIALCDERARLLADVERLTRERDEQKAKKRAAWQRGAAVAFGLMGMAEAIRRRIRKCATCRCHISIMVDHCMCCADKDADWELAEDERSL